MIAINKPPEDATKISKGKLTTLKKRDINPLMAGNPVFVNKNLFPIAIECVPSEDNETQTCKFTDLYGQTTTLDNIGFINQQGSNPVINVFKHPEGQIVTRMDFKESPICEIFGVFPSLTLKCSERPKGDANQQRVMSPPYK